MTASVLIIGHAGRLLDGLFTILRSLPGIGEIFTANDFEAGYVLVVRQQPSLVVVDADESFMGDCVFLKKLLSQYRQTRCLVIVNTFDQAAQAKQMGADAVLLRGFSTSALHQVLAALAVIPEKKSGTRPLDLSRQQVRAFRLSQKN